MVRSYVTAAVTRRWPHSCILTVPLDCKSLAPIWEKFASDFESEPSVVVAKVDAEAENAKATAQEMGVKAYPTIKFFPKGSSTPVDYDGGRQEQALVDFMNEKAGTHRVVGGGLDNKAGIIDSLDAIIARSFAGESHNTLSKELGKAAKNLKDKYAEYYVKVFGKSDQSGYVQKELARLEGLIKKGGLAPAKLDDLTSRANILRSFTRSEEDKENVKEEL